MWSRHFSAGGRPVWPHCATQRTSKAPGIQRDDRRPAVAVQLKLYRRLIMNWYTSLFAVAVLVDVVNDCLISSLFTIANRYTECPSGSATALGSVSSCTWLFVFNGATGRCPTPQSCSTG